MTRCIDNYHHIVVVNYGESFVAIPQLPGIYIIQNKVNKHIYVGSTVNLRRRWHQHSGSLNGNYHHNPHLQSAWNKYGGQNFCFMVMETVDNHDLILQVEQCWLDSLDAANRRDCYNYCQRAGSHLGRKRSDETRRKLSAAQTGKKATPEAKEKMRLAKLGKKQDPEVVKRYSELRMGRKINRPAGIINSQLRKFSPDQVRDIRRKKSEGVTYNQLSAEYSTAVGPIQRIVNRESYKDIE